MISINVDGSALYWHQMYMQGKLIEGIYPRWIDCVVDVSAKFSNRPYENSYSDIKSLSQTRTLQKYIKEFDFLYNKMELREEVAVGMFMGGLHKEIRSMDLLRQPQYLRQAYSMTQRQEENYNSMSAAMLEGKTIPYSISKTSFGDSKSLTSYSTKFSSIKPTPSTASGLLPLPTNVVPINQGQSSRF